MGTSTETLLKLVDELYEARLEKTDLEQKQARAALLIGKKKGEIFSRYIEQNPKATVRAVDAFVQQDAEIYRSSEGLISLEKKVAVASAKVLQLQDRLRVLLNQAAPGST